MKKTAKTLITSGLAILLCLSMLAGSTFAWFTDEVKSGNNVIMAGNLDIEMHWTKDLTSGTWINAEDQNAEPVFNYDKWEPGYTEVRYVKIVNAGNLAFKYALSIIPDGEVSDLADVIDVYFVENPSENISGRAYLASLTAKGTLRDAINGGIPANGVLLADGQSKTGFYSGEVVVAIALKMREEAGNEYMGKSIGDSFSLKLVATQYDFENDSFGTDYDSNVELPGPIVDSQGTVTVTPDANGKVPAGGASIDAGNGISALVPEGVQMSNGADKLTLSVSNMNESEANLLLGGSDRQNSINVHIDGIAAANTVPMQITVEGAAAKGLNSGSLKLYHVEYGNTVEMTQIALDEDFTAHNQFKYDPATGDVILNMASFSEIALTTDISNPWTGARDYTWYKADATELEIANADQLAGFGAIVGGMDGQTQDSFKDKTVKLIADINIGDTNEYYKDASENNIVFYPIGYWNNEGTYERKPLEERTTAVESGFYTFQGTFDGNGHVIANFYQNTWEMKGDHNWYDPIKEQYYRDGMGLFGKVYNGTVKNLTVNNFSSDGEITTTGVIAAYADGATFENIAIFNCNPRVYNIGNGGIVGCVGWYAKEAGLKTTFTNITVDNTNKISALWGSYDVACGGILGQYYPTSGQSSAEYPVNAGVHFENCHVSAIMDVYNDVCANYQYYAYRYTGMLIGSVRENVTIDGHVYPKMDGITTSGCTVHFGDWNDYYYCEIVANTTASYTHDHQMSRLTQVASVDAANGKVVTLDNKEVAIPSSGWAHYVVVKAKDANGDWIHGDGTDFATCYHFKNGEVWTHDMAGYHNGENGEKFIDEDKDGKADLKEDKQLIYREFKQLFTGYGWGVTSKGIEDFENVLNMDITASDIEKSVDKFVANNITKESDGFPIQLGELFSAKDGANPAIKSATVNVTITNVKLEDGEYVFDPEGKVSAKFVRSTTDDWTKGTLTLSGAGKIKITIQDYYYCKPCSIIVDVTEATMDDTIFLYGKDVYEKVVSTKQISNKTPAVVGITHHKGFEPFNNTSTTNDGITTIVSTGNIEGYFYMLDENVKETGHLLVVKYRVPSLSDPFQVSPGLEIFTSDTNTCAEKGDSSSFSSIKYDGEWHVAVLDLSSNKEHFDKLFSASKNGRCYAKYVRTDLFGYQKAEQEIEIEYMGMANCMDAVINKINSIQNEDNYPEANKISALDYMYGSSSRIHVPISEFNASEDATEYNKNNAYHISTRKYVSCIDHINNVLNDNHLDTIKYPSLNSVSNVHIDGFEFNNLPIYVYDPQTQTPVRTPAIPYYVFDKLYVHGWAIVEGGIDRYVYSVDGGATWHKAEHDDNESDANGSMLSAANTQYYGTDKPFKDSDKYRGSFQGVHTLAIDLSEYKGTTKNVILAAVPVDDANGLCILTEIKNVNIASVGSYSTEIDADRYVNEENGSKYALSTEPYVSRIDSIQLINYSPNPTSVFNKRIGKINYDTVMKKILDQTATVAEGNTNEADKQREQFKDYFTNGIKEIPLKLEGWAVVDGGISKLVWTYDGITWYDVLGTLTQGEDAIVADANTYGFKEYTVDDAVRFNGGNLTINFEQLLKDHPYLEKDTISITLGAVPANSNLTEVCVLYRICKIKMFTPNAVAVQDCKDHTTTKVSYDIDADGFINKVTACSNCGKISGTEKCEFPYVVHFDDLGCFTGAANNEVTHTYTRFSNTTRLNKTTYKASGYTTLGGEGDQQTTEYGPFKFATDANGSLYIKGWAGMDCTIEGTLMYRVVDSNDKVLRDWSILSSWINPGDELSALQTAVNKYITDADSIRRFANTIDLSDFLKTNTDSVTIQLAYAVAPEALAIEGIDSSAVKNHLSSNYLLFNVGTFTDVKLGCSGDKHTKESESNIGKYFLDENGCITKKMTADCVCDGADGYEVVVPKYVFYLDYFGTEKTGGIELYSNTNKGTVTICNTAFSATTDGKLYTFGWAGIEGEFQGVKYRVIDSDGKVLRGWTSLNTRSEKDEGATNAIVNNHGFNCIAKRYGNHENMAIDLAEFQGITAKTVTIEFALVYTPAVGNTIGGDGLIYAGELTNVTLPAKAAQ